MKSKGYSLLEVLMAITAHGHRRRRGYPAGALQRRPIESSRRQPTTWPGAWRRLASRPSGARPTWPSNFVAAARRAIGCRTYVDGNRNGVLARDIARGIDLPITANERLDYHFSGIEFGIQPNVTGIDPGPFNTSDPIQIGSSTLLSFSPTGSSTSGTLFIRGLRGNQFAVRVLGATGRTRILEFNFGRSHMAGPVGHERRASPRVLRVHGGGHGAGAPASGSHAHIVDLSAGGALIETDWRLLPGMRVEMQVGEPVPLFRVAGRILRCHVALLDRERIRYRGALMFEEPLPFGEVATHGVEPRT